MNNCTYIASALIAVGLFAADALHASTLGHWRFEEAAFLSDSSGNGWDLQAVDATPLPYTLPASGAGSNFHNPIPQTGATNEQAALFNGTGNFQTSTAPVLDNELTIEVYFTTSALAGTQGFTGAWASDGGGAELKSFFFGIASNGALRIGLRGENDNGTANSSLRVLADTDYYAAFTYRANENPTGAAELTFYLQDLSNPDAELLVDNSTSMVNIIAFVEILETLHIGGLGGTNRFNGVIDEVRISSAALEQEQLLTFVPEPSTAAVVLGLMGLAALRRR